MIDEKQDEYAKKNEKRQKVILDEASISLLERFNAMRKDRRRRVMSCGLRGRPRRTVRR